MKSSFLLSFICRRPKLPFTLLIKNIQIFKSNEVYDLAFVTKKDRFATWSFSEQITNFEFNGILTDSVSDINQLEKIVIKTEVKFGEKPMREELIVINSYTVKEMDEVFFEHTFFVTDVVLECRVLTVQCAVADLEPELLQHKQPRLKRRYENPLLIGHRGLGKDEPIVTRENTVGGFNRCAEMGLEYCELDAHFTKDEKIIVYHDFYIDSDPLRPDSKASDLLEKGQHNEFRHLTLDQLRLKLTPRSHLKLCPELDDILTEVSPHMGFLVEIKYPQLIIDDSGVVSRENGSRSRDSRQYYFSKNYFVDCILKCLLKGLSVRRRNIILLSFDPDLCLLLKRKQNCLPVMQITRGRIFNDVSVRNHIDSRMTTFSNAVSWARFCGLDGVVTRYMEEIKPCILEVRDSHLLVFCYGVIPVSLESVCECRHLGIDALIIDHVERFLQVVPLNLLDESG